MGFAMMSDQKVEQQRQYASNLVNQAILALEKIEDDDPDRPEERGRALLEAAQTAIESQVHVDLCESCMTNLFNT